VGDFEVANGENESIAAYWFQKAAEQGNATGQFNTGVLYRDGLGEIKPNTELSAQWFRKAADQGFSDAEYSLGVMYKNGDGVPQSDAIALEWFNKAADHGNAMAKYSIAHPLEYELWSKSYDDIGIRPTPSEIRAECKKLGAPISLAEKYIALENSSGMENVINSTNNLMASYLSVANQASDSKSATTVTLAKQALTLLDDFNAAKIARNVSKALEVKNNLKKLMFIIPKRIDSEKFIDDLQSIINEMNRKNAPIKDARMNFQKEIEEYNVISENVSFNTSEYTSNILQRFNRYIDSVNSLLNH
jgi:hypothetical protein